MPGNKRQILRAPTTCGLTHLYQCHYHKLFTDFQKKTLERKIKRNKSCLSKSKDIFQNIYFYLTNENIFIKIDEAYKDPKKC